MVVIHQTPDRAFCMFSDTRSGHLSDIGQKVLIEIDWLSITYKFGTPFEYD